MSFDLAPVSGYEAQEWLRRVARVLNGAMLGKTNNTGTVTLTQSVTSTTVTLAKGQLGEDTVILFMPTTASAATEFGAGALYVSSRDVSANQFTITHANTADADKTFSFILVG